MRRLMFFIITLALAGATIFAAYFLFFPRESERDNVASKQLENEAASKIEFSSHKSFLSRKYKFALEYPDDWVLWRERDRDKEYNPPDFLHSFCFTRGSDLPSDYPFCDFFVYVSDATNAPPLEATKDEQAVTINGVRGVKRTDDYGMYVVLQTNGLYYEIHSFSSPGYDIDVMHSVITPSFEFVRSSGPAIYRSRLFPAGGFEVVLPPDYEYQENPDGVSLVIFYWEGATASEGIGSKVYLHSTNAKSFEDFQKEIKIRDAEQGNITYTIGDIGGFQTILAKGYPGIANESSSLYAFTGNGWYFAFVDPPFDITSLKKI